MVPNIKTYIPTGRPRGRPPKKGKPYRMKAANLDIAPQPSEVTNSEEIFNQGMNSLMEYEETVDPSTAPESSGMSQPEKSPEPTVKRDPGRPPKMKKPAAIEDATETYTPTTPQHVTQSSKVAVSTHPLTPEYQDNEATPESGEKRPRGRPRKSKVTTSTMSMPPPLIPAKRGILDCPISERKGATVTRKAVNDAKEQEYTEKEKKRASATEKLRSNSASKTSPQNENVTPKKRGPGRPRKYPRNNGTGPSSSLQTKTPKPGDEVEDELLADNEMTDVSHVKRSPGRPRKVRTGGPGRPPKVKAKSHSEVDDPTKTTVAANHDDCEVDNDNHEYGYRAHMKQKLSDDAKWLREMKEHTDADSPDEDGVIHKASKAENDRPHPSGRTAEEMLGPQDARPMLTANPVESEARGPDSGENLNSDMVQPSQEHQAQNEQEQDMSTMQNPQEDKTRNAKEGLAALADLLMNDGVRHELLDPDSDLAEAPPPSNKMGLELPRGIEQVDSPDSEAEKGLAANGARQSVMAGATTADSGEEADAEDNGIVL